MSLLQNYAIWNNKGGVGKSTITFHIATRYAEQHPDRSVLVIDLCPQTNASMMLLGGGSRGEQQVLSNCTAATPRTIVGYRSTVIAAGSGAALPDPFNFVVQASNSNSHMPNNLYLVCGDGNLEPMSPAISAAAAAPALTPTSQPWRWIHLIVRELINQVVTVRPNHDWMVFIDTNPSFSIYTELAISAADRLITPVNADDSSRVATNAMFILLHGQNPPHPVYGSWTFASQAVRFGLHLPQIHLVIGNRLTQFQGPAAAFLAMSDATADTLFSAFQKHPNYFTSRGQVIRTRDIFRDEYSQPLRDLNTAGVVAAHLGQRLSRINEGYYPVHGTQAKVNVSQVRECLDAIDRIVARL
jgi:cellulose biosynthesis protein BcsQ